MKEDSERSCVKVSQPKVRVLGAFAFSCVKTGKKKPAEKKNLPVSLCLVVRVPADVLVARVFFGYIDPV